MNGNAKNRLELLFDVIDRGLIAIDSGELFESQDFERVSRIRNEMAKAFVDLLVWERPGLLASRGIDWPYRALKERYGMFCGLARNGKDPLVRRQARCFLAFLPFPMQWQWLLQLESQEGEDPEICDFLAAERRELRRKLLSKPQKHFKLRHFCQILKAPRSEREKGVLRIFSLPYLFVQSGLLKQLSERYLFYVEPPMGVIFRHAWWRYFSVLDDPCIFGIHSEEDRDFLRGQTGAAAVGIAHGDFMEDIEWRDCGNEQKTYDIVFNSTFDDMPRKRHELMLRLLQHPLLEGNTALFLGRGEDENVLAFKGRVDAMRLHSRVDVRANVKRSDIPSLLSCCGMGVHLSLYENACRSIYEFFRSNLPCVASASMGGMNLDLFNHQTGAAVKDDELPETICSVLKRREQFAPRRWFLNHSGSRRSTESLNEILRKLSVEWGYEWSHDIVRLGSSGASRYADKRDYEDFLPEFEIILGHFRAVDLHGATFSVE